MNVFNRIVLIALCVLLVAGAVAVIVLTWTIPNRSINWLADAVQWLDDNDGDLEKALLTSVSAFVGLVAVIVLLIELLPRRGPEVQVTDLTSGAATLSTEAIGQRIEEAVVRVPHVSEVRANVRSRKKGVLVSLDLQVDPEANLATVTDEAIQTAQEVLTERVHVALVRPPTAKLHYRELRLHRGNGVIPRRAPRDGSGSPDRPSEPITLERRTRPVAPPPEAPPAPSVAPEPPELPQTLAQHDGETDGGAPSAPEEPVEETQAEETKEETST